MRRDHHITQLAGYETGPDATLRATASALERAERAQSVVLVEGISDQIAIEALAPRLGRDLNTERVVVVPIGGAQAIERYVEHFAAASAAARRVPVIGLCDIGERDHFGKAFDRHGLAGEGAGFFVCDADLEAELIRATAPNAPDDLEAVLDAEGDLGAFRTMQKQAAWRDRPFDEQMHRWIRSHARRSSRYAALLVNELPVQQMPQPLVDVVRRA